ncbi:MAG: hypothetical protein J6K39_03040 [Clostridia bacterium]|nr:hypothetical protein [Clostridia bacterium]
MKKIILGTLAAAMCVTVTACGTSANDAALNNLGNQLDKTANTISNIQTVNPTDLNLSTKTLETIANKDASVYSNVINTQQALLNEEYYKMDILNKTSKIKNSLGKDLKLSKAQTNAIKELTNNLAKYTNSVEYSKTEMNSSVKSIVSMKKNVEKNSDKINAKLNRLACNSNSRAAYYENILSTLNELDCYISGSCGNEQTQTDIDTANSTQSSEETKKQEQTSDSKSTENKNGSLTKNIDTYLPSDTTSGVENCPNCTNQTNTQNNNSAETNNSNPANNGTIAPAQPYAIPPRPAYPSNGMNAPYNTNNAYAAFGAPSGMYPSQPYGYNSNNINMRYNRYNTSKNTDTYAPTARNIDTYRFNPANGAYGNNYNAYNTVTNGINSGNAAQNTYNINNTAAQPVSNSDEKQRLESFEEIKDGEIQKVAETKTAEVDSSNATNEIKNQSSLENATSEETSATPADATTKPAVQSIKKNEDQKSTNTTVDKSTKKSETKTINTDQSVEKSDEKGTKSEAPNQKAESSTQSTSNPQNAEINSQNAEINSQNAEDKVQNSENDLKNSENKSQTSNTNKQKTLKSNPFKGSKIKIRDVRNNQQKTAEKIDAEKAAPIVAHDKTNSSANIYVMTSNKDINKTIEKYIR